MKLYFSPLACSLATRVALAEAGLAADFVEVDSKTKRAADGSDFRAVHPLGLVPALRLDDGTVLTENAAILQWVADLAPQAGLAPPAGTIDRARLQQWLCFIGTELHKALFVPLLDKEAPAGARDYALAKRDSRLSYLARALDGRDYLLDRFSVADAYLFAVLNWSLVTPVNLREWRPIASFMARMHERPAAAAAFEAEKALYLREQAR